MLNILQPSDLTEELTTLYRDGLQPGDSLGWDCTDEFYTISPGFWTVITGIPSHGKSAWMDCVMVNMMRNGWKFICYSPESQPASLHLSQLLEKHLGRPFRRGYNRRMEPDDIALAMSELEPNLRLLRHDGGLGFPTLNTVMFTVQEILQMERWEDAKIGVVVDPWNNLDHTPKPGLNETQMTAYELMTWREWIRTHGKQVHGFIIAHPQKPQRDRNGDYRDVGLYDINGSAHWYNQSDGGIIVRRREDGETVIDIEKCRWKHLGRKGTAYLRFNSGTGCFHEQ
jgi:twinkle protein